MKDNYNKTGFETLSVDTLTEYRVKGIHLQHIRTGAEVYKVDARDDENVFGFAFRTPPYDDTGVAHILEHTVLCGSERFPVKDPFLSMLKGSTHTFLNAMTYPDKTLYPAASTVKQDFLNLLRVYGDAVFFPNLKKEAFWQEGHRLKFDEENNLVRSGIVLNEMKGCYSSPEEVGANGITQSIFPDTLYRLNYGGDPVHIPELTYDAFKNFHKAYYHPSNCRIFLYGNHDLYEVLSILDREIFDRFDRQEPALPIELQKSWTKPRRSSVYWASSENEEIKGNSTITLNWLWGDTTEPQTNIAARTLFFILLGHNGSPLQKAILDSGLGEDISPLSGVETEMRQMMFTVGLRGTNPEKESAFEKIVSDTLETCAKKLDKDLVEGALRNVEFRAREIRGGSPFGLRLMMRSLKGWIYGKSPAKCLAFDEPMSQVRQNLQSGGFEKLIRQNLLENTHRSTVSIIPDPGLQQRRNLEEREQLDKLKNSMTPESRQEIQKASQDLAAFQETPDSMEDLASIPFLSPSDLPREVLKIPIESEKHGKVQWLSHSAFANGVVYLTMAFDLQNLDPDLQLWMPLFAQSLTNVGIPGISYDKMAKELALKTGDLACSLGAGSVHKNGGGGTNLRFYITLKALANQWENAIEVLSKLLLSADFSDLKHIDDLFLELRNQFRAAVVPSGHYFAMTRAMARHSESAAWEDMWDGVGQLLFLHSMESCKDRAIKASEALTRIRNDIINQSHLTLVVVADTPDPHLKKVLEMTEALPVGIPSRDAKPVTRPRLFRHETRGESLTAPAAVSFSALSLPAPILGTAKHAHSILLSHLLTTGYLWENIRMKGGAYGTWATISDLDGVMTFMTFRDPVIAPSIMAFHKSLDWAETLDNKTVQTAIIGSVGKELKPLSPYQKGITALRWYLHGIDNNMRQIRRDMQLSATAHNVAEAARSLKSVWDKRSITVVAGNADLNQAYGEVPELTELRIELPV